MTANLDDPGSLHFICAVSVALRLPRHLQMPHCQQQIGGVKMRLFAIVTLAALFLATVAARPSTPATPASALASAPANNPAPAAKSKPPAKKAPATPPPGQYLRAICTLEPDNGVNVGQCVTVETGAITLLPDVVVGVPAPRPCHIDSLNLSAVRSLSAATIKTELGANPPKQFTIQVSGNYIYLYSTDDPLTKPEETKLLPGLIRAVSELAAAQFGYVVELQVPHASTLGSTLVASLQAIAPSGITVATAGTTRVRITTDGTVSCPTLQTFVEDFRRFANHTHSDTPVASVFFIDPAASGNALGATAIPYSASGAAALGLAALAPSNTGTAGSAAPATGTGSPGGSTTPGSTTGSPTPSGSTTPATTSPGGTPAGNTASNTPASGTPSSSMSGQTITIATATTTGSGAGAAQPSGTSTGPVTTTTITTAQPTVPPAPPTISPTPAAPAAPATATAFSVNGLDLLFTGGTPGDDAWITEKKRAIALLDLPQPQVLVNAWMVQNSTTRAQDSGKLTTFLHQVVNSYNDTIQLSLYLGWSKLVQLSSQNGFFDPTFYNYISLRTVANPPGAFPGSVESAALATAPPGTQEEVANVAAAETEAKTQTQDELKEIRTKLTPAQGVCPADQYCLGYPTIFYPAQPRLTDMLLTLLAAKDPGGAATQAIEAIEKDPLPAMMIPMGCGTGDDVACKLPENALNEIKKQLWLDKSAGWTPCGCQQRDEEVLWHRASSPAGVVADQRLPLECFRVAMQLAGFQSADESNRKNAPDASGNISWTPVTFKEMSVPTVGVARAALADFLFNYKMSQEFPHEFTPYDLTASAQALDSALEPYIHAFNEDLQAYQNFMRAEFVAGINTLKIANDKNSFLNDGIITVQTTSGDVASVSTATQNYLNVSKAPSISQLLSSVMGTSPNGTNSTTGAPNPLAGVISNLSLNEAQVLVGALAAYQSTSLNVNRQLNLVVKPRSLLGAEAAEIDVELNADQTGTPQYWSPGPTGGAKSAADLSAVSQHDVTTHVRIDSINLFDISSLTAIVSKGRDKFPLLPPFVEIPYIGTLVGIPLPAAREYHSSSAVLSAVIVPTATDIAYSLRFTYDRILSDGGADKDAANRWTVRKATSMSDFGSQPLREFHKMKLRCIATLGNSPYPVGMSNDTDNVATTDSSSCQGLTLASTLAESDDN
jgi:hypothetical protein